MNCKYGHAYEHDEGIRGIAKCRWENLIRFYDSMIQPCHRRQRKETLHSELKNHKIIECYAWSSCQKDDWGSSVELQALRTANLAAMRFAALINLYLIYKQC